MTKSGATLAVAGDLLEDVVIWTRGPIERGNDNAATVYRSRGGSAANVAAAASRRCPVRFIGRVGADARGDQLVAELHGTGIDVRVQRAGRTGTVVVLVDPDGERTMFPDRAAASELDTVDPGWLEGVGWLHVPLYGFTTPSARRSITELMGRMTALGAPTSIDVSAVSVMRELGTAPTMDLLDELAPKIVFANSDESDFLGLDVHTPPPGRTYIVKRGPAPVEIRTATGIELVPVPRLTEVLDSTGAGDAFAAGFLSAVIVGSTVADAVRSGSDLASIALGQPGALAG
ncbi:PfkB family carbohydrate kinase [Leifsonia bigeumensis]|uniref:PfkB family carbohydrate kinase n=1 Tax=Leifsonella bigeumensis TaxID=433643 RepID=A0ABP7FNI0_9MICO